MILCHVCAGRCSIDLKSKESSTNYNQCMLCTNRIVFKANVLSIPKGQYVYNMDFLKSINAHESIPYSDNPRTQQYPAPSNSTLHWLFLIRKPYY